MNQRETARRRTRRERGPFTHTAPLRVHRLVLSGELGYDSAVALEAAIEDLCAAGIDRLVLDLSRLGAIDRTGVDVILMRCRLCERRGVTVELAGARPSVASAFASVRLAGALGSGEGALGPGEGALGPGEGALGPGEGALAGSPG